MSLSDTDRLLAALRDGKPHSHKSLYRLGLMLHSRAADLRRRGYTIDVTRDGPLYLYRLTGSPADPAGVEAAAAPGTAAAAEQLTLDDAARSARASRKPEWS